MHGSFKKVEETPDAIYLVGQTLARLGIAEVLWYLDQPVSNSGRLKQLITTIAEERDWKWLVELVADPDTVLAKSKEIVVSADSGILDRCGTWLNLAREVVHEHVPGAWYVHLDEAETENR